MVLILLNFNIGGKTIADQELAVDNASIKLEWLVTPEGTAYLKDNHPNDQPYILIVVSSIDKYGDTREDYHSLIPLTNLAGYVTFFRPGKNIIHATIVFYGKSSHFSRFKIFKSYYLDCNSYQEYINYFINNGELDICPLHIGDTKIQVDVAKELFATPPPSWQKNLLRFILGRGRMPVDQCHFRRMWLTVIPFIFWRFIQAAWRVIVVFGCLLVPIKPNLKPIIHLVDMSHRDIYKGAELLLLRKWHDHETWPIAILLSPIYLLAMGLMYIVMYNVHLNIAFRITSYASAYIITTVGLVLIVGLIALAAYTKDQIQERKSAPSKLKTEDYRQLSEGKPTLSVKLTFGLAKSLVCKPFAKD